jgi:putative signal transducing protein
MVVVRHFRDLAGAEVASATLEAAGIQNSLADTYLIGLAWHYSTALRGIRVQVGDSDADEARDLLETTAVAEWPAAFARGSSDELCPACHAFDLERISGPRKTFAVMTAFGFPLWFSRSKMRCRTCGASRRVPLRFRPELALAWLILSMGMGVLTALVCLVFGYVVHGRRS